MTDAPSSSDVPKDPADGEQWLTTTQAAKEAGRHVETIRRWIRNGILESRSRPARARGGNEFLIRRDDLLRVDTHAARAKKPQPALREGSQIAVPGERTIVIDA